MEKNTDCKVGKWHTSYNDFGNYYCAPGCSSPDCYHPGEDWNKCGGASADKGETIYSIGDGYIERIGILRADGSTGRYMTVSYELYKAENIADYIYPGTQRTGTFDKIYVSYLHIDPLNNLVQQYNQQGRGKVFVSRGDSIGTIYNMNGSHLHLEIKTEGITANNCGTPGCAYCSDYQHLTDSFYIDPTRFIEKHLGDSPPHQPEDFVSLEVNQKSGEVNIALDKHFIFPGTATVNGKVIPVNWDADNSKLTFNLYDVTGLNANTFWDPVMLDVKDAKGNEIYTGCFPFKDVCAGDWYTRPVMKLWQEGIIEGYKDGTSGTFGIGNDSSRAEAIKMTVSVLESGNTLSE
ncbi:MAG: hypothetical protein D3920_17215, partial [Candidatus Electrothrix sp. AW2]|nr:hypothetical protein [Candidatus Electrothrix gigas]